jgi:hypothetical protein
MSHRSRNKPISLIACGFAWMLVAAAPAAAGDSTTPSNPTTDASKNPVVGVFAGFDAAGLAVYRLPPVQVSVDRKKALARIAEEDRLAAEARKQSAARNAIGAVPSVKAVAVNHP